MTTPALETYVNLDALRQLIGVARLEDLGPALCDLTSELLVPAGAAASAVIRARKPGRLAGGVLLPHMVAAYDPSLALDILLPDGAPLESGATVARISGNLRSLLALERIALNFTTHLSGIATLTARYVKAVAGTPARIYDTRKTVPGLRGLAKYAVVCGGGHSHRMGLYDAVLVKDNHLAHVPDEKLDKTIRQLVYVAKQRTPAPTFIEVEVDRLGQLQRVLTTGVDIVLLDNMNVDELRQAVALRNRIAPQVELESSGGVTLDTVQAVAQSGVDRIAIGALTHSAAALDLGLDVE